MDASAQHVDFIKKFGNKIFYGDASRIELLRAARADKARIFVLAVDDVDASMRIAETVKRAFPHLTIYARARNRQHTYRLLELGIPPKRVFRETMGSSVEMTGGILAGLGIPAEEAERTLATFRAFDERLLVDSHKYLNETTKLVQIANKAVTDLEELFEKDAQMDATPSPRSANTPD